jgi:ribosomal protein L20
MADERSRAVANHWAHDDVYTTIVSTLAKMGKQLDRLTLADLAPVDHVHAR